ncbi:VOC family protein [Chitinophaga sp.]|uniref:VOC family protein n=1 Tax=Chitinophaga sp. TaxID=1869181 RepID=UPI0025BB9C20|nr:VOC family protein [Chitinophaga sp.]
MKRTALLMLALVLSFTAGFAVNSFFNHTTKQKYMKRVTGIGGIFFKCKDPEKMKQWYHTHLGFGADPYGTKFEWRQEADSTKHGYTLWSAFPDKSNYFEKDFMINYRVENLVTLVEELKKEGVTILDKIDDSEYGKFVHILDVEGNKIELWEPKD